MNDVGGWSLNDFLEIPSEVLTTFVRKFIGACEKALRENEYWHRANRLDLDLCQVDGTTLRQLGLVHTRYLGQRQEDGSFVHTHIDLKFKDGTVIVCPSVTKVLWSSAPYIVNHLNSINFNGGGWVDNTDWSCFDHLLSHGH